jgi:predicted nucleic acid-binding protein
VDHNTVTILVLDSEAIQALVRAHHPKRREVIARFEAVARRGGSERTIRVIAPTAVRVEAGWDRTRSSATVVNRFPIDDHPLDGRTTDVAASIVAEHDVGVADAHIGALCRELVERGADRVVVLTSDPVDISRIIASPSVTAIRL